eukprot:TRINITY_DN10315_c0_g1_i1.p1 TRINITY_DN10315_c0_g1~~TRINITY_DN10315_c0_g1_i1.p1  ORF type:complete len:242 (-),score=27.46 TRINITY_DN10315_c0_g1_i1:437-1162(-)
MGQNVDCSSGDLFIEISGEFNMNFFSLLERIGAEGEFRDLQMSTGTGAYDRLICLSSAQNAHNNTDDNNRTQAWELHFLFSSLATRRNKKKKMQFPGLGSIIVVCIVMGVLCAAETDQPVICSGASAHLKVSELSFSPDPLQKGKEVHVKFTGNLDEQVTGGTVHILAHYLGIKILDQTESLCKLAEQAGQKCPIAAQPITLDVKQVLPSAIPAGAYDAQVNAIDQNGQEIVCVKGKVKIA